MSWVKIEVFLFLLSALLSSRQVSHIKVLIEQQDRCTGELWAARTDRKHFLSGKQIFSLWNMDEWTSQDVFSCCSLWVRQTWPDDELIFSWVKLLEVDRKRNIRHDRPSNVLRGRDVRWVSRSGCNQGRKSRGVRLVSATLKSTGDDGEQRQRGG